MSVTRPFAHAGAVLVAAVLAVAVLPSAAPTARAQEGAAALELISLPAWHGPGDPFGLTVRITNTGEAPLEDYDLVVGLLNRVETRSALHTSYDLSLVEGTNSFPVLSLPEDPVAPGASVTVRVDEPVDSLVLLAEGAASGVYPLKLTLQDGLGATLDTVTTQVLFYGEEQQVRLTIVPVLPLHDLPARAPDGVFRPDDNGNYRLEDAVSEGGWLSTMVEVLNAEAGAPAMPSRGGTPGPAPPARLRLGLVPSARLVEELADMADGYRRAEGDAVVNVGPEDPRAQAAHDLLEGLRTLLNRDGTQPILAPYAFADLPSIAATEGAVGRQISEAALVLHDVLGHELDPRWVFPPGGRLDAAALAELPPSAAGLRTLFSPDSLDEPDDPAIAGCPVATLSLACPLTVGTPTGASVTGYPYDPDIQAHLVELAVGDEPRLAMQRFFAETAMIREEQPGVSRVVHATTSTAWRPEARELRTFLRAIAGAPWLGSATPVEGIAVTDDRAERELVAAAPVPRGQPSGTYFEAVERAGEIVDHFVTVEPPAELAERLRRNVLVALARGWWDDREADGYAYAEAAREEVEDELAKIGTVGAAKTTLTSSQGALQFLIFNDTGYEVRVLVRLDARGDLEVEEPVRDLVIADDQQTVSYKVTARASGIFPITVRLETPDGFEIQKPRTITVRSTEFNEVALALTFGALAFLVLFYLVRALAGRRVRDAAGPKADPG